MLVNFATFLMMFCFFCGLGLDAGILELRTLNLRAAADAAALAAQYEMQRGNSGWLAAAKADASLNGFPDGTNGVTITVTSPPTSGSYSGLTGAVTVTVKQQFRTPFLGLISGGAAAQPTMQASVSKGPTTSASLSSGFNRYAFMNDGVSSSNSPNGIDGAGYYFSTQQMGTTVSWNGFFFTLGPAGAKSAATNVTVSLSSAKYSAMKILATGTNGSQTNQAFTVKYTDGSSATTNLNLSDWCAAVSSPLSGETIVQGGTRDNANGSSGGLYCHFSGFTIFLDSSKNVSSLVLPSNNNVHLLALDLVT